ncbi:MAG: hypothetical protein KAT43_04905 [Nanoarchaeota archaeon]|nr:hypothetical protein [Nanoarchaeota archaeon]
MELEEILRISRLIKNNLKPGWEIGLRISFSELVAETLPRDKFIDLELEVLRHIVKFRAKEKNIKMANVPQILARCGNYKAHSLHKPLLEGFDIIASLDLDLLWSFKGKRWGTIYKDADKGRQKELDVIRRNLDAVDISVDSRRLEKDLKKVHGRIYETLNGENAEYIDAVNSMGIVDLYYLIQSRDGPKDEYLKHVWACIASDMVSRNQALLFALSDGPKLTDLMEEKVNIPVILLNTPAEDPEALKKYCQEMNSDVIASWLVGRADRFRIADLQSQVKDLEEKRAQVKKNHDAEIKDRDQRYGEAQEKIRKLKSGEAVENGAALEKENAELKSRVAELEKEAKEYEGLAEEYAEDAAQLEEKLAGLQRESAELKKQVEDPKIDETPAYIIQNQGLQANIERLGLNYTIICAIVVAGFKWGRYSNTHRLSDESVRKNVRGKIGDKLMTRYDAHFKALKRANVILKGGTRGYSLNANVEGIRDPYLRRVVRSLLDMKKEL